MAAFATLDWLKSDATKADEFYLVESGHMLASQHERAQASLEVMRAFVELWQGKPERFVKFLDGPCAQLSSCFIMRGKRKRFLAAARGRIDGVSCGDVDCLSRRGTPALTRD